MSKQLNLLKTGYRYELSVKENAELNKCSVANVRKFIQTRGIDRRFDKALAMWQRVNDFADKHENYTPWKASKELGVSYATFIKYCGAAKPSQTDRGKVSRYGLSKFANLVTSVGDSDECLRGIVKLYVPKGFVDVDLTYSVGSMWASSGLPHPTLKFDKYPLWLKTEDEITLSDLQQIETNPNILDVVPLDSIYRELGENGWNTYDSVLFDLPFLYGDKRGLKIAERFSCFDSEDELISANVGTLFLATQLVRPRGVVIVKTQNIQTASHQTWVADLLNSVADEVGLSKIDEFIYLNKSRFGLSTSAKCQHVARKTHGYYIVYRKKTFAEIEKDTVEKEVA